jgi:hypothetical protein
MGLGSIRKGVSVDFSRFSEAGGDWLEFAFEVFAQLALVVLAFALSRLLWPDGLLATPRSSIELQNLLLAAGSVLVASVGLVMSYFVVVEPIRAVVRARRK